MEKILEYQRIHRYLDAADKYITNIFRIKFILELMEKIKIGIIICDRYSTCSGGKCFRAATNREGAFSIYKNMELQVAAFTTCGGCPGGNIEYAPEEMMKNGVTNIHFATGYSLAILHVLIWSILKNLLQKNME
jgi:predicted metal-binding protein